MATTIDNLQIEIESNAASAKSGIDDLADALEKLEQKSNVKDAIDNLKNLSEALKKFTDANKVTQSVTNLQTAVAGINSISIDESVVGKIGNLANVLNGFNGVKAGGVSETLNAMSRLGEVASSIKGNLGEFKTQVAALTATLQPLSETMTPIAEGFRRMGKAAKQTTVNVAEAGGKINVFALNANNLIGVGRSVVQTINRIARALGKVIDEAIQWDGVAARFGRTFGEQAEETYAWVQRLNDEMGINTQQFMQTSSLYAQMLTGFGVAAEDARKMALGYTELSYDIWASTNDRYKSLEEAQSAVASALAGELEPIRKAGFTISEAMLKQTAAAHGLTGSIQNMTEGQKSYLRYLTLVDQAQSNGVLGTYAKEMGNAEGVMRTLAQQVASLSQAFGSLFLPILVKVVPWVQALVELLTDAVYAIASFFGVDIKPIDWSGYSSGAGGAADATDGFADSANTAAKAAEDLKRATLGIDELNIISPPKETTGGSGASGGGAGWSDMDVDSLWNESIFENIQSNVDMLKTKLKEIAPVAIGIATAFAGWKLTKLLTDLGEADKGVGKLQTALTALGKGLAIAGISLAVGKLTWDFSGAYLENGDMGALAAMLGTTVLGAAVAAWLAGPVGAGLVIATAGAVALGRLGVELKEDGVEITDPQALTTAVIGAIEGVLGGALVIDGIRGGKWISSIKTAISGGVTTATEGATVPVTVSTNLAGKIVAACDKAKVFLSGLLGSFGFGTVALIVGAVALALIDYDFTEIGHKVGEFIGNIVKVGAEFSDWVDSLVDSFWTGLVEITNRLGEMSIADLFLNLFIGIPGQIIAGLVMGLAEGLANLVTNIVEFALGLCQGFKDALGIESPSKVFMEIGNFLVEGLWLGIHDMFGTLIENISQWVSDMIAKVKNFFGIGEDGTSAEMATIGTSVSTGLWGGVSSEEAALLTSFGDWVSGIVSDVKEFFGIGEGESEFAKIGKEVVNGIIDGIKGKATDLWNFLDGWVSGIVSDVKGFFGIHSPATSFVEIAEYCVDGLQQPFTSDVLEDPLKRVWNGAKQWWDSNAKLSAPTVRLNAAYGDISAPEVDDSGFMWAGVHGAEILYSAHRENAEGDQMYQSVYSGVYAAVMAAQRAANENGQQAVNVYLDGKQISSAIDRRKKEQGKPLMGTQVYSY